MGAGGGGASRLGIPLTHTSTALRLVAPSQSQTDFASQASRQSHIKQHQTKHQRRGSH